MTANMAGPKRGRKAFSGSSSPAAAAQQWRGARSATSAPAAGVRGARHPVNRYEQQSTTSGRASSTVAHGARHGARRRPAAPRPHASLRSAARPPTTWSPPRCHRDPVRDAGGCNKRELSAHGGTARATCPAQRRPRSARCAQSGAPTTHGEYPHGTLMYERGGVVVRGAGACGVTHNEGALALSDRAHGATT